MKNKVEAKPRKVNKKNRVVEPIRDVDVKHSLLNANSEPICATFRLGITILQGLWGNGVYHGKCDKLFLRVYSSTGLVQDTFQTLFLNKPCITITRDNWDRLFQPMFDEYFTPPSIIVSPVQEAAAPRAVVLADSHVSTSINQDAPSISIPSTQEQEHYPNISQVYEDSPKTPIFSDDRFHESLHCQTDSQGSSL
ncbi:hypothetical protein Tco_0378222 [Tanacetum coccineum]